MTTKNPVFFEKKVHNAAFSFLKKAMLLICFTCMCRSIYAQRVHGERIDPRNDKLEFQGYTIRPIPALGGSLGYDIFKDHKRLVHQYQPPVKGRRLYNKEDVYKVARWTIAQYAKTNKFPTAVPPAAVKALQLSSTN